MKTQIAETVEQLVEKRLKEAEDRKNRSMNLIFFHVAMSDDSLANVRKSHDLCLLQGLYKSLFPDKDDCLNIITCFRLSNKENRNDGKIKPLKLICGSKEQRRDLLLNSSKIGELESKYKNIIIVKDLTPEQRKASKKLNDLKKQKKDNGEEVVERFGELVGATGGSQPFQ